MSQHRDDPTVSVSGTSLNERKRSEGRGACCCTPTEVALDDLPSLT